MTWPGISRSLNRRLRGGPQPTSWSRDGSPLLMLSAYRRSAFNSPVSSSKISFLDAVPLTAVPWAATAVSRAVLYSPTASSSRSAGVGGAGNMSGLAVKPLATSCASRTMSSSREGKFMVMLLSW